MYHEAVGKYQLHTSYSRTLRITAELLMKSSPFTHNCVYKNVHIEVHSLSVGPAWK